MPPPRRTKGGILLDALTEHRHKLEREHAAYGFAVWVVGTRRARRSNVLRKDRADQLQLVGELIQAVKDGRLSL